MKIELLIYIVLCVIGAILYAIGFYQKTKGNVLSAVSELITKAEKTDLSGSDKMQMVVDKLYDIVPDVFKKFLTKKAIEIIAQKVFDWTKEYAKEYVKAKQLDVDNSTKDNVDALNKEKAAEIITALAGATLTEMKTIAAQLGVDASNVKTKTEAAKMIADIVMNMA